MTLQGVNFSDWSTGELEALLKAVETEKKRREKEKKYQVALNLRNALREFLDSGAECDFAMVMGLSGCDLLDLEVDNDCDWCKEDINYIEFDPFDTEILKNICNELTRCLGKLGE